LYQEGGVAMLPDSTSRRNHARARRSTYRSARAVRPDTHFVSEWTRRKFIVFLVGSSLLAVFTVLPIVLVDIPMNDNHHHLTNDNKEIGNTGHVGLSSLLRKSSEIQQNWKQFLEKEKEVFQVELEKDLPILFHQHHMRPAESLPPQEDPKMISKKDQIQQKPPIVVLSQAVQKEKTTTKQLNKPPNNTTMPLLARGVAGLPFSQTPALWGAQRGHIICDSPIDQNDLAYWNDPVGIRDLQFQTPFISVNQKKNKLSSPTESFLSFQPDPGGWNNVRMSFESMVVFAAATGRTLILPPRAPFYLLAWGKEGARTYGNFWSMSSLERRIPIISMKEFVAKYGTSILGLSDERQRKEVEPLADMCLYQDGAPDHCNNLWKYFHPVGRQPPFQVAKECLVFDENVFQGRPIRPSDEAKVTRFCGNERTPIYYNSTWTQPQLMHWDATGVETYRLLQHFYSAFFFTNTSIDNYMKRLVRDSLHYNDDIFCAAGKVIESLRREHSVFSSWHVRRGDFQYKETRIGIEEWYNNTKDFLLPGEALYIATDEKNKTFFKPLTETYGHPVKYFDDYKESILQQQIDSACWGMIESIVASSGRTFTGTWFSTFTGYINRLRGYRGISMTTSWFSYSKRRTKMHNWEYPNGNYFAREWPIAWVGIDGDELIEHESNPTEIVKQNTKKIKPAIMSNMEDDHDDNVAEVEAMERKVPKLSLDLLKQDVNWNLKPVARGISGRRIDQTPAMVGAIRAHVQCDINVDSVAYWNNPQGKRDQGFKSPFAIQNNNKYITFGIDRGGWNNIRMSMEIIFVIAFITGRTLVLPPETSLYLLHVRT
jgi:GDP-fucose protein O-fucosyltransferase